MEKKRLNQNWLFQDLTNRYECTVNLPHDATIGTERTQDGHTYFLNAGFRGVHCLYTKKIWIPEEYRGKALYLEFEGIYRDFTVSINGKSILEENYGYIPYEVQIDDCVICGGENVLQVAINTPEEGHNRWYAASGIYQDVFLYVGDPIHIPLHGVKVTTKSHNPAVISVEVALKGTERADVDVEIRDGVHTVAHAQGQTVQFEIPHAKLWTAETPNLYTAVVTVKKDGRVCDQAEQSFGIRTLEWDSERGFLVNGCRTLLKGGCIHNDNGVIGQVTNRITEERRIKNLKATGFNALRSTHHPMSPALLEMLNTGKCTQQMCLRLLTPLKPTMYGFPCVLRDRMRRIPMDACSLNGKIRGGSRISIE